MTCINPQYLKNIENDLKEKGFSFARISKYKTTTQERLEYFDKFLNDRSESEYLNNKIEKYLLENQKANMKLWAKKAVKKGIDTSTTKTLLDKIDSLSKVLDPRKDKPFLNGLVKQKLGFYLTQEEANQIKSLNDNIIESKRQLLKAMPDYLTYNQEQYAEALSDEKNYELIKDLAVRIASMKEVYDAAKIAADKAERLGKAFTKFTFNGKEMSVGEALTTIAGNIKSLKASFDISWGRQLTSAFLSGNKAIVGAAWKGWKEGLDAWKKVVDYAKTEEERADMIRLLEGLIMVRPNALNGNYARLGVAVGMREEAFPESLSTKIPVLKNIFIASDKGFNIAIQTARAEITDVLIDMANGDIGMLKEQNAGQFVNELTGRGKLPFNNPNTERAVNALLFAPRYLSSRIAQIYNLRYAGKWGLNALQGKETGMIDKMRAKASLAQLGLFAVLIPAIKGILRAMDDDDPHGDDYWERFWSAYEMRTSDFGKIVLGDTRIDLSAGLNGLITLSARVVSGKSVSISGVKREKNWSDVIGAFGEGKLSPSARLVIDGWRYLNAEPFDKNAPYAKNFMYQPITARGLLADTFLPISVENLTELTMPTENKYAQVAGILADIVGLGANTYGIAEKDIGKSDALKKAEFELAWQIDRNPASIAPAKTSSIMKKLSGARQERAVDDFKKKYNEQATRLVNSAKYAKMTPEEKSKALTDVRENVNREVKKKYNLK